MIDSEVLDNKIFIQIAAYRDPELVPTLDDCLNNADHPENLVFSIAWQHAQEDKWDTLKKYEDDNRFKIIDINYNDSLGCCWARNLLQQQYSGEKYTLQLDSHHRFIKGWDTELINMIEQLQSFGYKKPLLTSYASIYTPSNDPEGRITTPYKMNFDRIIPEGAVFFLPAAIEGWEHMTNPIPSRFYSAHFCFTLGQFVIEVPHNPDYLFHGEEISISARAYTWGYDLFHPHKIIVWHEYTRVGRVKSWEDDPEWWTKNNRSHAINRKLFGMNDPSLEDIPEKYGFGRVRTLREYEEYVGILFSKRMVHPSILHNRPPTLLNIFSSGGEKAWLNSLVYHHKHTTNIEFDKIPIDGDYDFIAVIFENEDGLIWREDATKDEIVSLQKNKDNKYKIFREFTSKKCATKCIVWPHYSDGRWGEKIEESII